MRSTLPFTLLTGLLSLALPAQAHPGEEHHHDHHLSAAKRDFLEHTHRDLRACSGSLAKRDAEARWADLRQRHISELRAGVQAKKKQSHVRRQDSVASGSASGGAPSGPMGAAPSGAGGGGGAGSSFSLSDYGETLVNTTHNSTRTDITLNTTSTGLFNSDKSTCLLQPEVTIGPYWVAGEYVREDVSEDQHGVPLYLSVQLLDTSSCDPLSGAYWEIWHCNSTGVYSGVVASGNGDDTDATNLNSTFLRGMQLTDAIGSTTIQTVFPGHYTGRATHAHMIAHVNATLYQNGTIGTGSSGDSGTAVHIGQMFFDQDLITAVEATAPYITNTQAITANTEDSILAEEAVEGAPDPFVNYVYLGDDVSDGVYGWITIGVDSSASYNTKAASYLTSEGAYANGDSSDMGGGMGVEDAAESTSLAVAATSALQNATASASTAVSGAGRRRKVL